MLHYSLKQRRLLPHCGYVYSMLQPYLQEAFKSREYLSFLSRAFHQLGCLYFDQGKMKEAEDMYVRALVGKEKAWSPEHMHALNTRYNLGLLYKERSMIEEAAQQFEHVVQGFTKLLGSGHSKTVKALSQLESCEVDEKRRKRYRG